jgi:hypothetical protein
MKKNESNVENIRIRRFKILIVKNTFCCKVGEKMKQKNECHRQMGCSPNVISSTSLKICHQQKKILKKIVKTKHHR